MLFNQNWATALVHQFAGREIVSCRAIGRRTAVDRLSPNFGAGERTGSARRLLDEKPSKCLNQKVLPDKHFRLLDSVQVVADDRDGNAARRNALGHFDLADDARFGVVDRRIIDVLVHLAFERPYSAVKRH